MDTKDCFAQYPRRGGYNTCSKRHHCEAWQRPPQFIRSSYSDFGIPDGLEPRPGGSRDPEGPLRRDDPSQKLTFRTPSAFTNERQRFTWSS